MAIGCVALLYQWRKGTPETFIVRAVVSWARALIVLHRAECGRDGKCFEAATELRERSRLINRVSPPATETTPKSGLASSDHVANLSGLVLGCIEADFFN